MQFAFSYFYQKKWGASAETYPTTIYDAWLGMNMVFMFHTIFYLLFPLLSVMPYGSSYYRDIHSGYEKNICVKISRQQYLIAKYIANFCAAAVIIALPLILNLMLTMTYIPVSLHPDPSAFCTALTVGDAWMVRLYYDKPIIYAFAYILIDCICAGMLSTISLWISTRAKNLFVVYTSPMLIYIASWLITYSMGYSHWAIYNIVDISQKYGMQNRGYAAIIVICTGMVVTFLGYYLKGMKRDNI